LHQTPKPVLGSTVVATAVVAVGSTVEATAAVAVGSTAGVTAAAVPGSTAEPTAVAVPGLTAGSQLELGVLQEGYPSSKVLPAALGEEEGQSAFGAPAQGR